MPIAAKEVFKVVCPHCQECDVSLDLVTLVCHCGGCSEEFTAREARDMAAAVLAEWERVCRWIQLAETV